MSEYTNTAAAAEANASASILDKVTLRLEKEEDYRTVEELTREAFWNVHRPGCDEHYCMHAIRPHSDFIRELDYVAVLGDEIIGHIAYTKAKIVPAEEGAAAIEDVAIFGPISVSPKYQRQGIGRLLIQHTLQLAKTMGLRGVFTYGEPRFYGKVGFRSAERYDVKEGSGRYWACLMAYELYPGALSNAKGGLHISKAFWYDMAGFDAYDATFPKKEIVKGNRTQLEFDIICSIKY